MSDKRYVQKQYLSTTDSLRKSFAASVSSMYDYYPFGMPMLERSTSDTGTQTAYVSQVVYSPQYTTVNNAMAGASILTMGTMAQPTVNAIVNYYGYNASISKVLTNLVPHMPVTMTINLLYADKTLYIAVAEASATNTGSYTNLLYSANMGTGTYMFSFVPTQSNVELKIDYPYFNTKPMLCFTLDSVNYKQQTGNGTSTQLVQISNKLKGGYRFGYNGQEKVDEIAGEGNEIEFKYRLYDPRIGKFKSADPLHKSYPWNSDYAFAENRVIDGIDLEGLEFYYAADGTVLRKNGDNIQVMLVNNDFVSKTAYASIEQLNKNSTNIGMTNYELNARAFLTMIRKGEGTLGLNGYKAQFAGKQFNDFSDHPNLVVNSGKYSSSASGAYQVLSKTWNSKAGENAKKGLGIKDFSPESQDKFGLWLISNRNALGDVIDGNVRGAIGKTNKEWASLPGSPYGQPTQTLEGALQNFKGAVSKELNGKSEIATPKGDLEKTIKTLKK